MKWLDTSTNYLHLYEKNSWSYKSISFHRALLETQAVKFRIKKYIESIGIKKGSNFCMKKSTRLHMFCYCCQSVKGKANPIKFLTKNGNTSRSRFALTSTKTMNGNNMYLHRITSVFVNGVFLFTKSVVIFCMQ